MKKSFLILFLTILIFASYGLSYAEDDKSLLGEISFENINPQEASKKYSHQADQILRYFNALPNKTKADEEKYLNAAKYFYYQAARTDKSNTDALVGKARIALYENHIRDAKNALSIALNINEDNPKVNYYFGETFFKDGEFAKAVDFYLHAYTHGYRYNFWTNYKLGVAFEKLDEPERARFHYLNAVKANPNSKAAAARLAGLDMIKTDYETYRKGIEEKRKKMEPISPEVNAILFGEKRMEDALFNAYYIANKPVYLDELYPLENDASDNDSSDLSDLIISPLETEFVIDLEYLAPTVIMPNISAEKETSLILPEPDKGQDNSTI